MSGGHFSYNQYRIEDICETLENDIHEAEKERPEKVLEHWCRLNIINEDGSLSRLYSNPMFSTKYEAEKYLYSVYECKKIEENKYHNNITNETFAITEHDSWVYPDGEYYWEFEQNTIDEMKKTLMLLKECAIRVHRIDWLLSGDDGEESFHSRLNEELKQLKKEKI